MNQPADISKPRADAFDATLTDAQRWALYDRLRNQAWHKAAQWAADEYGIEPPSRSAIYRFAARLRKLESAHRLESALAAREEAGTLVAAATDDKTLIAAYKTLAQDTALRGDAKTAETYTRMALALADKAMKAKELALKAEAQKTKDEQLRLAREKFEAAEKRLDAVMGAGATDEQRAEYLQAAEAARDGLPVVWPAGSQVSRAEGARGQDPFSAFIEHQEKLVVLMATGGTLTSLAQADTGALAGGAQMDVWEQIVRRDAAIIGDALDRRLFRPALEAAFPGKAAAAHFELGRDAEPDAGELFDLAAKARTAGYRVEKSTLEEESGYTLVEDTPAQPGGFGGFGNSATPLQLHAKALQNARRGEGATTAPPEGETRSASILRDFAADMGPAAEKINLLLKRLDAGEDVREDAARLAEELPSLMPGDPAMAAVLEEAMAEEFAAVADKTSPFRSDIEDERMNSGEEEEEFVLINDNDNRDKDGQFAEKGTGNQTGGPHETNLEKRQRTCQEALDKFNASTDHPSDDDVASGKVSIEEALEKGFSTTFAGHKLVFFTKQKITDKYVGFKDDPGRIKLVKEAVEKKNRMQPRPHNGEQTAFVESTKTSAPASKLLVVVADTKTGVVVSIMKAPVEYVGKHFK